MNRAMRAKLDEEAKERKAEGGKSAGRGRPQQVKANLPEAVRDAGQVRDQMGKLVGVSGRSIDYAAKVQPRFARRAG